MKEVEAGAVEEVEAGAVEEVVEEAEVVEEVETTQRLMKAVTVKIVKMMK